MRQCFCDIREEGIKKFKTATFWAETIESSSRVLNTSSYLHFPTNSYQLATWHLHCRDSIYFSNWSVSFWFKKIKGLAVLLQKTWNASSQERMIKPVYFIPDRSDTFITCEPDPLLFYHLYPDGSGSSCQTFQYEFIQNKITLSTKPRSQSDHEFKAAVEKDDVWGIKIKKVVHQKLEAPDKIGGQ